MKISHLTQALCADRTQISKGVTPSDWINAALPKRASSLSFQYFVHWDQSPLVIDDYVWMTKLIGFENTEELNSGTEADILQTFISQGFASEFQTLSTFCKTNNHNLTCILLPELPMKMLNDETPIWVISEIDNGIELGIRKVNIAILREQIKTHSGGPVHVGSKGLTYGTSAVECYLSKTDAAYPGDVDCIISTDDGIALAMIEFKKHTIADTIGNHTASRYYQEKDKRKYDRLASLHKYYVPLNPDLCPLAILYFSTRTPIMRIQLVEVQNGIRVVKDSDDISVAGLSDHNIGSQILAFMGVLYK